MSSVVGTVASICKHVSLMKNNLRQAVMNNKCSPFLRNDDKGQSYSQCAPKTKMISRQLETLQSRIIDNSSIRIYNKQNQSVFIHSVEQEYVVYLTNQRSLKGEV